VATIPTPEAGLVIAYAYLWRQEHQAGQDEGVKDRPSVIVLAVERQEDGATVVTVLPIAHASPTRTGAAIEIPQSIKRHLGQGPLRIRLSAARIFQPGGQSLFGFAPDRQFVDTPVLTAARPFPSAKATPWRQSSRPFGALSRILSACNPPGF
jgi:hypothetical protein